MDIILNHSEAKNKVREFGWDAFLKDFQDEYKEYDLYACSTYWENDHSYICKVRGSHGDLIIGWEGVHNR